MVSTLFLGFCADKDFCIRDNKTRPKKCHYNIIHTGSFKTNLTTRSKEKKRVPSSCVLPGHETCRVKSKNVLSVIILASRKWASPPLPVPGGVEGGGTGTIFVLSTDNRRPNSCNNDLTLKFSKLFSQKKKKKTVYK